MGLFSKDIETMDDLFVHQLKDIYYAEKRIVGALPEMIEKATSPELKSAFESHLGETRNHVRRVDQVFQMHGVTPETVDCPAIDGIIEEADEVAGEVEDKRRARRGAHRRGPGGRALRNDALRNLIAWANSLGRSDCAHVLKANLDEEEAADKKFTKIAESGVNAAAA